MKRLKQVIDPELAKALSHEIRSHILATLGDRVASPSEIAREIDVPVMEVSYHVRELRDRGLIKLVRTEKRRGFREHFYTLSSRAAMAEARHALLTGTFDARGGHRSRTTMLLDERGWTEVVDLMDEALERVLEVGQRCAEELERSPRPAIPTEVFMSGFETASAAGPEPRGS